MPNPCRILVLNERDPLHPAAGGAEVHVAEISRRMAAMGYAVTLAASSFPGARREQHHEGFEIRRLGHLGVYYPKVAWTCARETRLGRFDVVVEHLNKVPFCAAIYSSAPVLAVNHHLFGRSAFLQVAWPIALGVISVERLIPWVYRKVPFLAVSESSRQDLIARGIGAEQIGILHNGITFPHVAIKDVTDRPCRVAYLGRLEPYKRIDLMLRALVPLVDRFPSLEIVLIGRGRARADLERVTAELGLGDRTRFAGFVSDAERNALLAEARVCVCPSVKEGWGITVIEVNAVGTPVVATDAPGLRDAVRHAKTGLLVTDGKAEVFTERLTGAIAELLSDDALATRLSREARAWSRRFDWDSAAERMAEAVDAARGSG
jgi:glycosyltransferase involved in cell wall biosynthesis